METEKLTEWDQLSEGARALDTYLSSDRGLHDSAASAIKTLRRAADRAASEIAKHRAEWHDDPSAEDHADFHAPANEQFPREVRDELCRYLLRWWLDELNLRDNG